MNGNVRLLASATSTPDGMCKTMQTEKKVFNYEWRIENYENVKSVYNSRGLYLQSDKFEFFEPSLLKYPVCFWLRVFPTGSCNHGRLCVDVVGSSAINFAPENMTMITFTLKHA